MQSAPSSGFVGGYGRTLSSRKAEKGVDGTKTPKVELRGVKMGERGKVRNRYKNNKPSHKQAIFDEWKKRGVVCLSIF